MTIRTILNLRKRRWLAIMMIFFLVGCGSISLACQCLHHDVALALFALLFVLTIVGAFYPFIGIRCPMCRRTVPRLIYALSDRWGLSDGLKECPHCRTDLDTKIQESPTTN